MNSENHFVWTNRTYINEINNYSYLIGRFADIDENNMNLPDERDRHTPKRSFCERCNGFFRNRRCNASKYVLQEHYKLLIMYKKEGIKPDFKTALQNIFDKTGVINPKLASQALHFLNRDLPIYSRPILNKFLHTDSPRFTQNNIDEICELYNQLQNEIDTFCDNDAGQKIIADFKSVFGGCPGIIKNITNTKIIDFYFWLPTLEAE